MHEIESIVFEMWDYSEEEIIQEVMAQFSLGYSEAYDIVKKIIHIEEDNDDPTDYTEWQSYDPDC